MIQYQCRDLILEEFLTLNYMFNKKRRGSFFESFENILVQL